MALLLLVNHPFYNLTCIWWCLKITSTSNFYTSSLLNTWALHSFLNSLWLKIDSFKTWLNHQERVVLSDISRRLTRLLCSAHLFFCLSAAKVLLRLYLLLELVKCLMWVAQWERHWHDIMLYIHIRSPIFWYPFIRYRAVLTFLEGIRVILIVDRL